MVIYGLKQNFVIRPSPYKGNEKGLGMKKPTKFCFRSILGRMLNSYQNCNDLQPYLSGGPSTGEHRAVHITAELR